MFELLRYDLERRLTGIALLSAILGVLAIATAGFYPSVEASGDALETYVENLPPAFQSAFGIEAFTTVEGFLAVEFYQFAWVILLGMYYAYRAGSLIAGDVEDDRVDMLLALPIRRRRYVLERYLALVPSMVVVNVAGALGVLVGVVAVGEWIPLADLLVVHLLSLPYIMATASLGLVLSVVLTREDHANRAALGLVFALFLLESLASASDYEWVGAVSPTRYYDPTAVLTQSSYDVAGAVILLVATLVLVAVAIVRFERADLT